MAFSLFLLSFIQSFQQCIQKFPL